MTLVTDMTKHVMTVNPGSSGLKLGLYRYADARLDSLCKGAIDGSLPGRLQITAAAGQTGHAIAGPDLRQALPEIIARLCAGAGITQIDAVGHRVVHGGDRFRGPTLVSDSVIADIAGLVSLAPLHQPRSLLILSAMRELYPDLPQTASFDTAFHQTQPPLIRRIALPRTLRDAGIQRYGFHGLSYQYISGLLRQRDPDLVRGNVVAAHLGSGVSLCALRDGQSHDCSMGFSTLDGVPMATRSGRLDPGILLHMMKAHGRSPAQIEDILYHQSGLLGLSGLSGDMRDLVASSEREAGEAVEIFCLSVAREIAAQAAVLGGLDGIVFTAGIGEHMPEIRARICWHLQWLGVELEPAANAANAFRISGPTSRVSCLVIPTDEEVVIARQACEVLWP